MKDYSPRDIRQLVEGFSRKINDVDPDYRIRITEKVAEHLLGTWQTIRLMEQQGAFNRLTGPLPSGAQQYWEMVAIECEGSVTARNLRSRFLRYLLGAFSMFVLLEPAHPAGTPFPGGDSVEFVEGMYYCPVRTKANDVGGALCPFCPAVQTPEGSELTSPYTASEYRRQQFISHYYQNYNG
jgi:uncharacterized protein (UPF0305 family)